ncbi:hypothetical protein ACJBU6_08789 [Exserohilum turcicum]
MRVSTALLLAPALSVAVAEEAQVPLLERVKGFFNKATAAVAAASSSISTAPAAATESAKVEAIEVIQHPLTLETWKDVLTTDAQNVLVFTTGGNNTCFGLCENVTKAWNDSLPYIAAMPNAPKFVYLDSEEQPVLANSWSIHAPSLYFFEMQPAGETPVARYTTLNRTTTTSETIKELIIGNEILKIEPYWGHFHPFNGTMQTYNLALPYGYVTYGFSKMPSWMPMIIISFISRSFM